MIDAANVVKTPPSFQRNWAASGHASRRTAAGGAILALNGRLRCLPSASARGTLAWGASCRPAKLVTDSCLDTAEVTASRAGAPTALADPEIRYHGPSTSGHAAAPPRA